MKNPNPIFTTPEDPFVVGESDFQFFNDHPSRCECGAILYCLSGSAIVSVNLHQGQVRPNSLIFLMPGSILMTRQISPDFRISYCAFTGELFAEAAYRLEPLFFKYLSENPIAQQLSDHTQGIEAWLNAAAYTYADRENIFRHTIIRNRLQNIFLEVYDKLQRKTSYVAEAESNRRNDLFRRFMQLVREECVRHREVAYYADKLCISSRYLSSILRSVGHKSPKEVIDEFVILEIKMLFQSTDLSAQEIVYRLHFPDQSYLGHYFRRHTGLSPTEYRNRR